MFIVFLLSDKHWKREGKKAQNFEIKWIEFDSKIQMKIWKVQSNFVEVTANRNTDLIRCKTKELKHTHYSLIHTRIYTTMALFLFNFIIFLSLLQFHLPCSCSNNVCNYIFFCWCCWIFFPSSSFSSSLPYEPSNTFLLTTPTIHSISFCTAVLVHSLTRIRLQNGMNNEDDQQPATIQPP